MATQYWVGGFFIDLSRNQITQNKQSKTIAPKALAVLTYLAKNQGKVISQDELLDHVWHDTTVSPNTLQKSIAQLRKALGESGNLYIRTHAKQGYSLECDVRWQESDEPNQDYKKPANSILQAESVHDDTPITDNKDRSALTNRKKPSLNSKTLIGVGALLAVAIIMVLIGVTPQPVTSIEINEIRALTATDNKEFSGVYSPDGQYVVFHRYSEEFCINNIWAKDLQTQEEFQLTDKLDSYGSHSFSKDGKQLVFIQSHNCREPIEQKACYKLMTLDFKQALKSPREPEVLLECKNSEIRSPKWLNDNDIVFMQKNSSRWKMVRYSLSENQTQDIFQVESGNIIDFDYSKADDLIALTSIHEDDKAYIAIIKPNGELISSHQIVYPPEIPKLRLLFPNFSPISDQLILSTGRQLFTMSHNGLITNLNVPLDEPMSSPLFHPNGKRAIVIKGHYDSDIVRVPLSEFVFEKKHNSKAEKNFHESNKKHTVIERSNLGEDTGIFQPGGDILAFESQRSGEEQIWLSDGESTRKLTNFPMDSYIDGMNWAADGKSILIAIHGEIKQVFLDGKVNSFEFKNAITQLFSWNSRNNTALALVRVKGLIKFAELNLIDSSIRIIKDKKVSWAQYSEDGRIIYSDHLDRFWKPGPAEDELIEKLNGQGSIHQFVSSDNVIYSVNENFKLWSYDLNGDVFKVLGDIPRNLDYITDINDKDVMLSIRIAAKKEVAELTLRD